MNINDYMGQITAIPKPSVETWRRMIDLRDQTFKGFARIEEKNGGLVPYVSLSTTHGQEALRILFFRVLEEAAESAMATEPEHQKEEIIDSINYLLSAPLMDPGLFSLDYLAVVLDEITEEAETRRSGPFAEPLDVYDLGYITYLIGGQLADTFRNRAWMNNAQDVYFSGVGVYYSVLGEIMNRYFDAFDDWAEFYRYYVAKDMVLQFRLNTNY